MATKSASNVVERTPVSGQASADVKGTHGSGFAASLVKFLEEKSQAAVKLQVSLKDKLKGFYDFSSDDYTAFFATTKSWRDDIAKEAEKAKLTLTQFRRSAPGIDYVYVSLSVFDMFARACSTGWRPDVDRLSWAALQEEARNRLNATATAEKQKAVQEELAKWQADDKVDPEVKKANIVILNKRMEELATVKPDGSKTPGAGKTKTNFERATEMLDKFPQQDLEMVAAWLQKKLEALAKARPTISTPTKGAEADPTNKAPAKTGTPKARPARETAEAAGEKRSTKRSRK